MTHTCVCAAARECELMTSSGQLGEGLPFEVRDRPKKSCSTDDKYVGCYMKRGFFEGTDVFFVPLTAGLNVSSYGDGTSCTVNHVICTNASPSPPSPPPQPPQPPWQPLSETFPGVGIATSGTCESHGGQSITSAQACELVATYGHPALPWEVPLQREFDEVSYEDEPKHCYVAMLFGCFAGPRSSLEPTRFEAKPRRPDGGDGSNGSSVGRGSS